MSIFQSLPALDLTQSVHDFEPCTVVYDSDYFFLAMGKFMKTGKVVLVLNGRFAGRKAVIVKVSFISTTCQEEFEDTKGEIRFRISKKNGQHNGQKKKYKRTKLYKTYI